MNFIERENRPHSWAILCAYWEGGTSTDRFACALAQTTLDTTNSNEVTKRTQSSTEQASQTKVSGQCEVLAKCERTLELPRAMYTGARLARREDGEKCSGRLSNIMETETELFGGRSGETKTKNFPFHFLSAPPQTPPPKK
jgi:hypothetical protein